MIGWWGKGLTKDDAKKKRTSLGVLFSHSTTNLAPLCMVLALVGILGGTRGYAAAQKARASCCKGLQPYNSPILN